MILVGCQPQTNGNNELHGRILLWHSWSEAETAVLEEMLQQFMDIHPEVTIITAAIPADELRMRYETTVPQGLGPNLLIGDADWIPDLIEQGLIANFSEQDVSAINFSPAAVRALRIQAYEGLYGLPLSLSTDVLYYNADQVNLPAQTLNDLWEEAEDGRIVAIPITFVRAYWGIHDFGNGLFNSDDQLDLNQSGFVEWLTTLKDVQEIPNMVLSRDAMALQQLFTSGRAAYYVGRPEELGVLQEALGEDRVKTETLPGGDVGLTSSLLSVEVLMLNTASSQQQTTLAVEIAQFLTNQEQSTQLMRQAGKVPANRRVEVNPQIYPSMADFVLQTRTAVTLPPDIPQPTITELGDLAYANVLSGLLTPLEAVCDFGRGFLDPAREISVEVALPDNCPNPTEDS